MVRDGSLDHWQGFSQEAGEYLLEVGVNMAPKPGLPLPVPRGGALIRGVDNVRQMALYRTLEHSGVRGPITEFICWADVVEEVTEDLRAHCRSLIDLFATAVGAAVSRQLLATEIGEDEWRSLTNGQWQCTVARPVALIEAPTPTHAEVRERTLDWITGRKLGVDLLDRGVLPWLLRAWREAEAVSKFLALFVPIEMLLAGYSGDKGFTGDHVARIQAAVTAAGYDDGDELCRLVDVMSTKLGPSLASRFAEMAEALSPGTAAADVKAFRKFAGMRNALVHRGKASVELQVKVTEVEVVRLQDLAERYVFASLFPSRTSE